MIPEDFPDFFPDGNPHEAKFEYIRKSSGIICVSNYTKSRLLAHNPELDERKIRVIHHASKFRINQREIELMSEKRTSSQVRTLLYVGARSGYKNFEVLIPVMRDLVDDGWDVRLVCVGGGKFSTTELEIMQAFQVLRYICQKDISDQDLKLIYQEADCHVTTSLDEGFGLPLLEAMSLGCPTLITSAGSLKEISKGNSIEFESHEDLLGSIISILGNNSVSRELSWGGHRRSQDFGWETTANQTVQFYEDIGREP
jgi:mannosyltransferase